MFNVLTYARYLLIFMCFLFYKHSSGQLYICTNNPATAPVATSNIYEVDLSSCSIELITVSPNIENIAFNPVDKKLYCESADSLYQIDVTSGEIITIGRLQYGTPSLGINALTCSSTGTLYAATASDDNIYQIDPSNANVTLLGSTGTGIRSAGDLTSFEDGTLYLAGSFGAIVKIDLDNISQSTVIDTLSGSSAWGMVSMDCPQTLILGRYKDIYQTPLSNLSQSELLCGNLLSAPLENITDAAFNDSLFGNIDLGPDTSLCTGNTLALNATVSGNFGNLSYRWQDNSNNVEYNVNTSGTYIVSAYDDDCSITDTIVINYSACDGNNCLIYVENTFTPNNDGLNDYFSPTISCQENVSIETYNLNIYNRWGNILFNSNDMNNGWDGSYKNNYCPIGTYVYTIDYQTKDGDEPIHKRGRLTLLR